MRKIHLSHNQNPGRRRLGTIPLPQMAAERISALVILEACFWVPTILWMDEILHQMETMVETIVCWYSQKKTSLLGFLGGAKRISSVHSMSTGF